MDPISRFNSEIMGCRQKYYLSLNLRTRQDNALYEALAIIFSLALKLRADGQLRDAFYHVLRSQKMKTSRNEILLLIKYAFFPSVLSRRKKSGQTDRKPDLNKASSYAKVLSYAFAHKVRPENLVKFVRDNGGIQSIAKAESKRHPRRATRLGITLATPVRAPTAVAPAAIKPPRGYRLFPVQLWCTTKMAETVLKAESDAYYTSSTYFIIRVEYNYMQSGLVTAFTVPSPLRPFPNPPIGSKKNWQRAGRGSLTRSPDYAPARRPSESPSKSRPSRQSGKPFRSLGKAPWLR